LLDTSVEYLLTGIEAEDLNDTERELMRAYRKLSSPDKKKVLLAVNAWAEKSEFTSDDGM